LKRFNIIKVFKIYYAVIKNPNYARITVHREHPKYQFSIWVGETHFQIPHSTYKIQNTIIATEKFNNKAITSTNVLFSSDRK